MFISAVFYYSLVSSRSFNTISWLFLLMKVECRARQVIEKQINHNMTSQVPVQKVTSLGIKFEILVTKGSPSYSRITTDGWYTLSATNPPPPQIFFLSKKFASFPDFSSEKIISIDKILAFLQAFEHATSMFTTAQSRIWVGLLVTSLQEPS